MRIFQVSGAYKHAEVSNKMRQGISQVAQKTVSLEEKVRYRKR
jgi:hypothetical protein